MISTHAPLRGATRFERPSVGGRGDFYSRPSARGDIFRYPRECPSGKFLLTPLCEGRLLVGELGVQHEIISTHAPLRGATCILSR